MPLFDPRPMLTVVIIHKFEALERRGVVGRVAYHPHTDGGMDGLMGPDGSEFPEVFRPAANYTCDRSPETPVPRLLFRRNIGDDFRIGDEATLTRTATRIALRLFVNDMVRREDILAGSARH